jgi:hypothetical protein
LQRRARADVNSVATMLDGVQQLGGDDDIALRRRAAGERGLRADRKHVRKVAEACRKFGDRPRTCHATRFAARKMCGVLTEPRGLRGISIRLDVDCGWGPGDGARSHEPYCSMY